MALVCCSSVGAATATARSAARLTSQAALGGGLAAIPGGTFPNWSGYWDLDYASWTPQASAPDTYLNGSPSMASSGHTVYVVSINAVPFGTPSTIFFESYNGTSWGNFSFVEPGGTKAMTNWPPAIAINQGIPVVVWTDSKTGDVEASSLTDGDWSAPVVVGAGKAESNAGPAVTANGFGALYAVWKGKTGKSLWMSIYTGGKWVTQMKVPGSATFTRPAVTFFPPAAAAVIAWTTTADKIQYESFGGLFPVFGKVATFRGASSDGPALAVVGSTLYVAYKALSSESLDYAAQAPKAIYGPWTIELGGVSQALTGYGPALVSTGTTLMAAWTGKDASSTSDAQLWYSTWDPTNTFVSVSAYWNVPAVASGDCSDGPFATGWGEAAFWVGLDAGPTIEQVGTTTACGKGNPVYYAWSEMVPDPAVRLGVVNAGDEIFASVKVDGSHYALVLDDLTSGWLTRELTLCPSGSTCLDQSAEVIAEAPAGCVPSSTQECRSTHSDSFYLMPDFQAVRFSGISVASQTTSGGIGSSSFGPVDLEMLNSAKVPLAEVTSPISDNAFTDSWEASG